MWDWLFIQVPWWTPILSSIVAWAVGVLIVDRTETRRLNRLIRAYRDKIAETYRNDDPDEEQ